MEFQIANKLNMKFFLTSIFLLLTSLLYSQNDKNDYYKLFKNGKKYEKPVVYLLGKKTNIVDEKLNGDKIFVFENNIFIYESKLHEHNNLNELEIDKIEFTHSNNLLKLEHFEFVKRSNEIKSEKGFKPVAPLKHIIFKIYIVICENNNYQIYEVDWETSKF